VPFEIPDNWEWCKLGDIVDFQGGYAYKSNTYVNQSDWQVIRIGNVKNDNLVLDTQPVFVEEVIGRETKKYLLQKDDILFTMTGTKGKRDYFYSVKVPSVKKKLLLNQRVGCLRRFSSEVNIDFLCFALKGEYVLDAIFSTETGNVSQGNIGSENTLNLNIAIPPLAEQRRIVSEIERWFSLIDIIENGKQDLQTTIKQAKNKILDLAIHGKLVPQDPNDEPASELLKRIKPKAEITCDNAHYPKVWQKTILGDIFNHNTGKALNSSNKEGIMKDYLTTSNVYWNKFDFSVIKQMPYKESELDKCTVTKGDLLVCEGGDIGRAAIWNYDFDICIQNHIHRLRPKGELCVAFYYYILLYLKENNLIGGKGIGLLGLSSNALHKIDVPLPPIEEQYRIVQKIEELFSYFDNIQKTLEA
jgi:type I restriction enzyme S subunit